MLKNFSLIHRVLPKHHPKAMAHFSLSQNNPELAKQYSSHILEPENKFQNGIEKDFIFFRSKRISVVQGDLTEEDTDVIVNPANINLNHGGGVAAAIVRKGGPKIQEESNHIVHAIGKIKTGKAVITGAGNLKCKYIIHAVGPIYTDGNENELELLAKAVRKSLHLADTIIPPVSSISIPAISSGSFGFPKDLCAHILFETIMKYAVDARISHLQYIRLINIDDPTVKVFYDELQKVKT